MANKNTEKETVRGLNHYRRKCQFQKQELKRLNEKCNKLQDTINELNDCIEVYQQATNAMNNRKYYKKFLKEYRQQPGKELSVPDFDYVYELYFEQKDTIIKQTIQIKSLTEQKREVLIQAINRFMSANGLYQVVGDEILPWEPTEEVEHLFNMSISGDEDEVIQETDRVIEELIGNESRWKNSNGKDPYTCAHCGHKEMYAYTECPNCRRKMLNAVPSDGKKELPTNKKEDTCYATWIPILKNGPGDFQCSACNFKSYNKFDTCPECECIMLNADPTTSNKCEPEKIIPRCNKCDNSSYCTKDKDNDNNCPDYKKDPPDGGSY